MDPQVDLILHAAQLDGRAVEVRIAGGVIQQILDLPKADASIPDADAAAPSCRLIDGTGLQLVPSFANAHTHAAMTLFRGWGDDLPLMTWLNERIWPAEGRMTPQDVYLGTRLALVEMIRSGTTCFSDMYWHAPEVARAASELGLRARIGAAFVDLGQGSVAKRWRRDVEAWIEQRDAWGPRIAATVAPHAIYTVSTENLRWLGELAAEHDLLYHIHLSETRQEVDDCVSLHGVRPTALLDQLGLVSERLVAAHGVYLDRDELEILGEDGATIVTNPAANLKLATGGIFDYAGARSAGVRVVLGTDGVASNNNLDLFEELKLVALLQKHRSGDATTLPASEAMELVTSVPAQLFGVGTGRIEEGQPADLLLLDLSGPATQPGYDLASDLVYAANSSVVHTTICDGQVLMHDRRIEVVDEEEVIRTAAEAGRRLTEAA